MKRLGWVLMFLWAIALGGCAGAGAVAEKQAATQPQNGAVEKPTLEQWCGVYASPKEVGGFTGTVLALEKGTDAPVESRRHFYTDVGFEWPDPHERGKCTIAGSTIYVDSSKGGTDTYTLARVQGQLVLMRNDAWKVYQERGELYDYGILIKVSEKADPAIKLETVGHPSIKLLYSDPSRPWHDPFVQGPNGG